MSKELGEALRNARKARAIKVKDLAADLGIQGPAISQWEAGKSEPKHSNFVKACEILGIDPAELIELFDNPPSLIQITDAPANLLTGVSRVVQAVEQQHNFAETHQKPIQPSFRGRKPWIKMEGGRSGPLARDVPVLGIAVAGETGEFYFNGHEIDRVERPAALASVTDLFAVYLTNDSMYPAWKPNSLIFVSPHRSPTIDDDVIIELKSEQDGESGHAFLKRLVSWNNVKIVVRQFNPCKQLTFDLSKVERVLRVIPYDEALGIS